MLLQRVGDVTALESRRELVPAIIDVATSIDAEGIIAFSELVLFEASIAAAALGLRGLSPAAATRVLRKDLQRAALASAGVRVPKYQVIREASDLIQMEAILPAVIKPVFGVGSLAVELVDDATAFAHRFPRLQQAYRSDSRMDGFPPLFIAEEMLVGADGASGTLDARVSVESFIFDRQVRNIAVTDKLPLAPGFREVADIMPSRLDNVRREQVNSEATAAIEALGIENGVAHTELMLTQSGPVVIEVNGRVGGGATELLHEVYGCDIVSSAVAISVGRPPIMSDDARCHAAFITPQLGEDCIGAPDVSVLRAIPGVVEVSPVSTTTQHNASGTNRHVARVLAVQSDLPGIDALIERVLAEVASHASPSPPRPEVGSNYDERLADLRGQVDAVDRELLRALQSRMGLARAIGRLKQEESVALGQEDRGAEVLRTYVRALSGCGVDAQLASDLAESILTASASIQEEEIMERSVAGC